jgi:hypothetical protein
LWRDRLLISLAPASVAVARVTRGPRPRLTARRVAECDPGFGAELWQGAVAALGSALEPLRGERMHATVVLSNHFVRYAVVPFDAAVSGPEEDLALARFHFAKIHGERAKAWDIRMSEEPRGAPRLASAVDAGLIDAIRVCFPRDGKLRLASVQPYLMSAFNTWRRSMVDRSWLLLVEPQRACLALLGARKWIAVHNSRGEFQAPDDWAAFLDRQRLRTDTASAGNTVLIHAPASRKLVNQEAPGWKFVGLAQRSLHGYRPLDDGPYSIALTAL